MGRLTNVDEDVQPAKKLNSLRHSILARLLACNVRLDHFGNTAFLVDHSLCLLSPIDVEVHQGNFGAVAGQENSSGTTIANLAYKLTSGQLLVSRYHHEIQDSPFMRDPAPVTIATSSEKSNARGGAIVIGSYVA